MDTLNRLRWWLVAWLSGIDEADLRFARKLYDYDRASRAMQRAVQGARRQSAEGRPPNPSSGAGRQSGPDGGSRGPYTEYLCCGAPVNQHHWAWCPLVGPKSPDRPDGFRGGGAGDPFVTTEYKCCRALLGGCHSAWCVNNPKSRLAMVAVDFEDCQGEGDGPCLVHGEACAKLRQDHCPHCHATDLRPLSKSLTCTSPWHDFSARLERAAIRGT
jgi:hypothetical protein